MKIKMSVVLFLLVAALGCTAWAAGEQLENYGEAELFQEGGLNGAQTNPEQLSLLNSEEEAYQRIYAGLCDRLTEISLSDLQLGVEQFKALYEQVINDHPELFYVQNGYRYSYSGNVVIKVTPNYLTDLPDDAEAQLEEAVAQALARVEPGMSQMEQALVLHDYLVEHVAYNWEVATTGTASDQMVYNVYGALVNGDAVCQGYALAYKLLLNRCGINCVLVSSSTMNHAWNLVEIDGSWYHVDTTWDDPTPDLPGYCKHENFLLSDAGITETGHSSWADTGITVSESEPDGIFRGTNNSVYRYGDGYYYLKTQYGQGSLYRADSLTDTEPDLVGSLSLFVYTFNGGYYNQYSILWRDGVMYYVGSDKSLTAYDLTTGEATTLGTVPFTASASADGYYDSTKDTIGLCYDSGTGTIVAVSKTRPDTVLATFLIADHPVSWDQLPDDTTALAGCVEKDGDILQVGLVWSEETDQSARLLAAFYKEGQLVEIQIVSSDGWTSGLNVLVLDVAGYAEYDQVTLFLLSDLSVPYCAKNST